MKFICLLLTLTAFTVSGQNSKVTTIYLIRHAEKASSDADPDLSEAGRARAQKWAAYFADKSITVGYTSPYRRTKQTISYALTGGVKRTPGTVTEMNIKTYDPNRLSLKDVADDNQGKSILVVGHSNTIPGQINTFLSEKIYSEIPESEFGNLYIIRIDGDKVSHEMIKM